jgi:uncharacterized protein (DUF2384 family)
LPEKNLQCTAATPFEGDQDFLDWLHTRNTALGEVKPIDWMNSSIGREQLLDLLVSIEYGMYS